MQIVVGPLNLLVSWEAFLARWVVDIRRDEMSEDEMTQCRKEAREIGQAAWDAGGVSQMMQLYHMVPDVNYFPRVVEVLWGGIGTEKDINEGWNA